MYWCEMCDNDILFTVGTAVGMRSFCSERCYCEYHAYEYKGEGYYGYTKEDGSLNRVSEIEDEKE